MSVYGLGPTKALDGLSNRKDLPNAIDGERGLSCGIGGQYFGPGLRPSELETIPSRLAVPILVVRRDRMLETATALAPTVPADGAYFPAPGTPAFVGEPGSRDARPIIARGAVGIPESNRGEPAGGFTKTPAARSRHIDSLARRAMVLSRMPPID